MSLNAKVLESINSELPAMVAGELKNFIASAESDKVALATARVELEDLRAKQHKFIRFDERESAVLAREKDCTAREQKLALEEAVLKVKTDCENSRVSEIRELVRTVFQSNRLDYNLSLGIPLKDQYGHTQYQSLSGNITKTP